MRLLLTINPSTACLRSIRQLVAGVAKEAHVDDSISFRWQVAVQEALTNAIRYGEGDVGLEIVTTTKAVTFTVVDRGPPFSIRHRQWPDGASERGRGMLMIKEMASHVRYVRDDQTNKLALTFKI